MLSISLLSTQPPRPTLFPYTTLFRSQRGSDTCGGLRPARIIYHAVGYAFQGQTRRVKLSALVDRKSTRLNSSHRCISYAVFCLKKKKNNNGYLHPTDLEVLRGTGAHP